MPKINPAIMAKLKRQRAERTADALYAHAANRSTVNNRDRLYWVVNSSNRRTERPVTLREFSQYLGPKATLGVWRQYTFYPAE